MPNARLMIPTSVPTKIAAMIVPTPTLPRLCNTVRQVMADTRTIVQSKPILTLENSICVSSGSVSFLLILFLLLARKGLRRFVGSIGVYALWLFVAISLLLPFPQMVYKTVTGRELFQQQSKFSVMNLVDLAQKNQKVVDNKSEKEYNALKKTSLSTGKTAQNKLSQQGDAIDFAKTVQYDK